MTSTTRRAILHLAAMALPVLTVVACIGGVDNKPLAQMLTPDSGSSTGTGAGGGAALGVGLYKLSSFNGAPLPDTIIAPGADSVSNGDSTRIIVAILDSAELQLDTDSTVIEKDFFMLPRDVRAGTGLSHPEVNFNLAFAIMNDSVICTGGTYIDTAASQTSLNVTQQTCGTYGATFSKLPTTYAIAAGDSLTGTVFYQWYDSAATLGWAPYQNTATLVWKYASIPVISPQHGVSAPRGAVRKGKRIIVQHQ